MEPCLKHEFQLVKHIISEEWKEFFTDAGIQTNEATDYANKFVRNRIRKDMLVDVNKDYLKDMGITIIGDVIAILRHVRHV